MPAACRSMIRTTSEEYTSVLYDTREGDDGPRITGNRGGRLWRGLSHVVDWFATLVDGAGGEPPPGKDSISMWGALRSGGASPRTEALLQLAGPAEWAGKPWMDGVTEPDAAIRVGKWKL
eukprot:gene13318-37816_t